MSKVTEVMNVKNDEYDGNQIIKLQNISTQTISSSKSRLTHHSSRSRVHNLRPCHMSATVNAWETNDAND